LASGTLPCKTISEVSPGHIAFPDLQINVPGADLYIRFDRFSDKLCQARYTDDPLQNKVYSSKFEVTSSKYFRIDVDPSTCPQENVIFAAGEIVQPQPKVTGVFDAVSKKSRTDGNIAKALVFVKPDGIDVVGCEPSDPGVSETQDCFPYSGYGVSSRTVPFDIDGTASFTNFAITMPSPGLKSDPSSEFRRFHLRMYVNSFTCEGGEPCGYRGKLVYVDCPFAFYIRPNITAKLSFLTEPGDVIAGSQFLRQPKLQYQDAFGNLVPQVEDCVEMTLVGQNLSRTYNQRYFPENSTTPFKGTILNQYFVPDNETLSFTKAGVGFFLTFQVLTTSSIFVTSVEFSVFPCGLDRISVFPNEVTVGAGESICGPRGSAWDEVDEFREIGKSTTLFCTCRLSESKQYQSVSDDCSNLCFSVLNGTRNGYVSRFPLRGSVRTGRRSWQDGFYDGALLMHFPHNFFGNTVVPDLPMSCKLADGCRQQAFILEFDSTTGNATMEWVAAEGATT